MNIGRKLAATTALIGSIAMGGMLAATPASAAPNIVACPSGGTWSHGIELWAQGFNVCFAGTPGYTSTGVNGVWAATSGWNNGYVDNSKFGKSPIHPGDSLQFGSTYVYAVEIV